MITTHVDEGLADVYLFLTLKNLITCKTMVSRTKKEKQGYNK